jgi:hypothetical protein
LVHRRLISLSVKVGKHLPQGLYLLEVLQVVRGAAAARLFLGIPQLMMVLTSSIFVVALINLIGRVGGHGDVINVQSDIGGTPRARHHRVYLGGDLMVGWTGNGPLRDRLVILKVRRSIP